MTRPIRRPESATLLDVLIDGFEKNEILYGFHWRQLPLADEAAAVAKFAAFADEARCWKGPPMRDERDGDRRVVAWDDLEIRQAGRAVLVLVRAPWFDEWWHDRQAWEGDPFGRLYEWLREEKGRTD